MTRKPWPQRSRRIVDEDVDSDSPIDELLPAPVTMITTMQADCCIAKAAYLVVLPASAERSHPAELLLCGHHFRAGRQGLQRSNAIAFDQTHRMCTIPT